LNNNFAFWMTGLPCSGKSTIAKALKVRIPTMVILDGDVLREWLSPKDFSRDGRSEHNRRVAHLAKFLLDQGLPVCVALISPYRENRETAKKIIGNQFIEVYVKCSLEICQLRDVKGMYKLAREGKITNFTGLSDPYEPPENPDVTVDTENASIEECARLILSTKSLNQSG
jgi:adenylylsulfate kinase